MKDHSTAEIIPFPGRFRAPAEEVVVVEPPVVAPVAEAPTAALPTRQKVQELATSSQRLAVALSNLSVALTEQRDATQRWKNAIEDLASKMRSLGDSPTGEKKLG